MRKENLKEGLKVLGVISLVILIGLLTINQAMEWFYKAEFLKYPCQLCEELNPHLSQCFEYASVYHTDLEGNIIENITEYKKEIIKNFSLDDLMIPTS